MVEPTWLGSVSICKGDSGVWVEGSHAMFVGRRPYAMVVFFYS